MKLPLAFTEKMKRLLGEEYGDWLATYDNERRYGLRVNTLKVRPDRFLELTGMAELAPVPWAEGGFTYKEEERPGRHPHYHAGLYYIQEPSAMVPAELLDARPGDRVLDLCAAPGGKSTQLAAKLQGQGLLVANDNAAERTKALARNIELAGVRNAVVLNEEPARLAGPFNGFFTKILVDAPCSGEGMFRKDESMIAQWEKHSVERCSLLQRDILRHAADMLAPGGTLVYSTCTFSPEENETQIASLLRERPELAVEPVALRHGWVAGRPDWTGADPGEPASAAVAGTVRLWPHLTAGEGHYAAVIRHTGPMGVPSEAAGDTPGKRAGELIDGTNRAVGASGREPSGPARSGGRGEDAARGKAAERKDKDRSIAASARERAARQTERLKRTEGPRGGRREGAASDMPAPDPEGQWRRFAAAQLVCEPEKWPGRTVAFGSRVYLQPEDIPPLDGLRVVRAGWYLGEASAHRFEPSQALAMGLTAADAARSLRLAANEPDTARYLRGDTLAVDAGRLTGPDGSALEAGTAKGWVLMLIDGFPAGWGKWDGGMLKNGLAPGWRRMG